MFVVPFIHFTVYLIYQVWYLTVGNLTWSRDQWSRPECQYTTSSSLPSKCLLSLFLFLFADSHLLDRIGFGLDTYGRYSVFMSGIPHMLCAKRGKKGSKKQPMKRLVKDWYAIYLLIDCWLWTESVLKDNCRTESWQDRLSHPLGYSLTVIHVRMNDVLLSA